MIVTPCLRSDNRDVKETALSDSNILAFMLVEKSRDEERLCNLVLRAMLSITLHMEDFVGLITLSLWEQLQDCCLHSRRDLRSFTNLLQTLRTFIYYDNMHGIKDKQTSKSWY